MSDVAHTRLFRGAPRAKRPPPLRLTFARHTIASDLHPERNEDALLIDRQRGLAAVFDGVGGSVAGEVAARLAARVLRHGWKRLLDDWRARGKARVPLNTSHDIGDVLDQLLRIAHEAVRRIELPNDPDDERRQSGAESAATTAALAVVYRLRGKRGQHVTCAWVGDSRVYRLRARGRLIRLTCDDGLLSRLVHDGVVSERDATRIDQASFAGELPDIDQSLFNRRNGITQSLGGPHTPEVHLAHTTLLPGERLLLCTDGIHDNLTDRELEILLRRGARTTVARTIVAHAHERSREDTFAAMRAKPDDMTAIVITCDRAPA